MVAAGIPITLPGPGLSRLRLSPVSVGPVTRWRRLAVRLRRHVIRRGITFGLCMQTMAMVLRVSVATRIVTILRLQTLIRAAMC